MKYLFLGIIVFIFSKNLLSQNKEIKKAHEDVILSVTYSPNGNEILTSDADNELKIWSSQQKRNVYKLKTKKANNWQAIYNKNGSKIYACSKEIAIFDTHTRKLIKNIAKSDSYIYSIALSQKEKYIFATYWDKKIRIWDIDKDSLIQELSLHKKPVLSVSVQPQGNKFVTASSDKTIALWQFEKNKASLIKQWKAHDSDIQKVLFSPCGKYILSASSDETIKLWNAETQTLKQIYRGHSAGVNALAFSPNAATFISGGLDAKLIWWNTQTAYRLYDFKGHKAFINSVAFSPKGKQIVSVDYNMVLRFWDLPNLKNDSAQNKIKYTQQLHRNRINQIAVAKKEDIFASVGKDSLLIIWGLKSALPIHIIRAHQSEITCVAISPNSKIVATGSKDKNIKLWDSKTGKLLKTLKKHNDWLESLAFSPKGTKLLSSSWDKSLILWDINSAKAEKIIKSKHWTKQVGFISEDTIFYASDEDYVIHFQNIETGEKIKELLGHSNNIRSISLSEDKKLLVSAANDSSFIVWDIEKSKMLKQIKGKETKYIYDCDFLSNSKQIAIVSSDGFLRIFELSTGKMLQKIKLSDTALSTVAVSKKENLIICGGWDKLLNVCKLE